MYWLLVRRALLRRKIRLLLTELSLVTAFFLFALLQGLNIAFQHAVTGDSVNRLMVMNKGAAAGLALPVSYKDAIVTIAGVTDVTPVVSMQVYYQDPQHHVEAFGVDAGVVFDLYPEWRTSAGELAALKAQRDGAIVGLKTARKYGWQIGQVVPLVSQRWFRRDGSSTWPVRVVGFYKDVLTGITDVNVLMNIDYLWNGRAPGGPSDVDLFIAGVRAGDSLTRVSAGIDDRFANSQAETESETEQAFGMTTLKRLGDLNLFVGYIVAAMFFALLFVTSLTLLQSAKSRTGEFGAMQAIGFTPRRIALLLWGEAVLMCGIGALVGVAAAAAVFPKFEPYIGIKVIPMLVVVEALAIAIVIASVIVVLPIRALMRAEVSHSLAQRVPL